MNKHLRAIEAEYNKEKNLILSLIGKYVEILDDKNEETYYVKILSLVEKRKSQDKITDEDFCYAICDYIYYSWDAKFIGFFKNREFYTFNDYEIITENEFKEMKMKYLKMAGGML